MLDDIETVANILQAEALRPEQIDEAAAKPSPASEPRRSED
jgi:hypothetical protein